MYSNPAAWAVLQALVMLSLSALQAEEAKWSGGVTIIIFNEFSGYPEAECVIVEGDEYVLVRKIYNLGMPIKRVTCELSLQELGATTPNPKIIFLKERRFTQKEFSLWESMRNK